MARYDDGDRVAAVGQADGTRGGVGPAQPLGDLAVRRGLAVADRDQLRPHRPLELAAGRVEWQVELLEVAVEVGAQLAHRLDQDGVRVVAAAARAAVVLTER